MEINTVEDIVSLLMRRDNISENEAWSLVEGCRAELDNLMEDGGSYDEAADIVCDWLSLEPDVLDIMIMGY
jgi:hypothetical protein